MGSDFPWTFLLLSLSLIYFVFIFTCQGFSVLVLDICLQYCLYHSTYSFLCYTKNMDCLHQCFCRQPILDCQQGTSLHAPPWRQGSSMDVLVNCSVFTATCTSCCIHQNVFKCFLATSNYSSCFHHQMCTNALLQCQRYEFCFRVQRCTCINVLIHSAVG